MTFVQRKISVTITLMNGQFGNGGNSKTIAAQDTPDGVDTSAPWVSAHINSAGGAFGSQMQLAIYGMSLSDMNQMSTIGKQLNYMSSQNKISVQAGDSQSGMSLVFSGAIFFAFVDASNPPDVCLRLTATPGGVANAQTATPISIVGSGDLHAMMNNLASQIGFGFEGNGINAKIATPYLWGSVGAQIKQVAQAAGVEHILDRGTLAIWQPGGARGLAPVSIAPPDLVTSPAFNQAAVIMKTIFRPAVQNGGTINLQTMLTPACGKWTVTSVQHDLEANMPNGKWFTHVRASGFTSGTTP